ncbi:MAG: pentapeptide repeat-containing protein [Gaiellaceae bacterium]
MTDALLVNRPLAALRDPWAYSDVAFSERLDGHTIQHGMFAHCTFANVSFKGCEIADSKFIDCAFISCYFRKAEIRNSQFDGCKFIDCEFPKLTLQSTKFMFPQFRGCFIPFNEMRPNLPPEPELRSLAAAELAREAYALGHPRDARLFRLQALRANEAHLWGAFRASSSYYKQHFNTIGRAASGARWVASQANRVIWGNGERGLTLLVSFLLLTLVVFPIIFNLVGGVHDVRGGTTTADYLLLSADSVTGYNGLSSVVLASTAAKVTALSELIVGLVWFGLFITILFRRITRWR